MFGDEPDRLVSVVTPCSTPVGSDDQQQNAQDVKCFHFPSRHRRLYAAIREQCVGDRGASCVVAAGKGWTSNARASDDGRRNIGRSIDRR